MQQGNYTNITWSGNNFFSGYVSENNIYTYTGELIGVNLAKYQELEQALLKCKNRLIELGEIKVPKTPEEIIAEQSAMLDQQSQAIKKLLEEVNGLKSNNQLFALKPQGENQDSPTASVEHSGSVHDKNKRRRKKTNTTTTNTEQCDEQGVTVPQ